MHAFFLVFQLSFDKSLDPAIVLDTYFSNWDSGIAIDLGLEGKPDEAKSGEISLERVLSKENEAFIREEYLGTLKHLEDIDNRIGRATKGWELSRLLTVDAAILRLATYEVVYSEIPYAVAINEAVDLAKKFGSDESPSFINGALRTIAHEAGKADA
jgi:N utilization substance protein B